MGGDKSAADRDLLKRGVALQLAGKLPEAEALYVKVAERSPRSANAWHLLGTIAIKRRDMDRAFKLITHALSLEPNSAEFHHNIAYVHGAMGRTDKAEAHYRRAIRLKPAYAEAYFNLANTTRIKSDDRIAKAVEGQLREPGLTKDESCFLHFAAGKVADDRGAFDHAFAHYRLGNAIRHAKSADPRGSDPFAAIVETFDAAFMARHAGAGAASDRPIFVAGMPRSGTSLVEQILASHPAIHGVGELPDIQAIASAFAALDPQKDRPFPAGMANATARHFKGYGEAYVRQAGAGTPGTARHFVDKMPLNFRYLGLIALMLPKARIIHCRRNTLDTLVSCFFQNFTSGVDFSFSLQTLGRYYQDYRRMMDHWREILPVPILDVQYEELVGDIEGVGRRMLAHCGLDWHPDCARFHEAKRAVYTASRWQVRQPLYNTSVGRWRRYEAHLGPLIEALGEYAEEAMS